MNNKIYNESIPSDIKCSLDKFVKIIEIIENNILIPKDSILLELEIELEITLDSIRKIFRLYNPYEISLVKYILERKRSEAIKSIINIKDRSLININIIQICQCTRSYFDKMLYKDLGIRTKDIINNSDLYIDIIEKIDANIIKSEIIYMINELNSLEIEGIIDIKRTKLYVKNN